MKKFTMFFLFLLTFNYSSHVFSGNNVGDDKTKENKIKNIEKKPAYKILGKVKVKGWTIGVSGPNTDPNIETKYRWIKMPDTCFDVSDHIFVVNGREFKGGPRAVICPQ